MRDYALNRAISAESIGTSLFTLFRNWQARRQMAALAKCDDRLLEELGISRGEVLWAARLPLSRNPRLALEECAFLRARHCSNTKQEAQLPALLVSTRGVPV
jgi:uncharacterized protein YjiS (DUF1127 family)